MTSRSRVRTSGVTVPVSVRISEKLLLTVSDISLLTGIGMSRMRRICLHSPGFPRPVVCGEGSSGRGKKYYKASDIRAWVEKL